MCTFIVRLRQGHAGTDRGGDTQVYEKNLKIGKIVFT